MSRLVVVSNRVATTPAAAAGGLAVALGSGLRGEPALWFGWSGERIWRHTGELTSRRVGDIDVVTLDLEEADYEAYYNGYANAALWPLFHSRTDLAELRPRLRGGLRPGQPTLRRGPGAAAAARRHHLGARLSSDPARAGAAPAGGDQPDRVLPAHSLAGAGSCSPPCRATATSPRPCSPTTWSACRRQTASRRSSPTCCTKPAA